ncbi:MAG: translation initiation factor IF-2 [Hyphomicrobiales bacterium]|nr:translation initiation factor IF-2 [Hyphomicrobiales bacterium]
MSETKETDGKATGARGTMTLNVKRTIEQGQVRQSFSHGRSKPVLVEKKRKRVLGPGETAESAPSSDAAPTAAKVFRSGTARPAGSSQSRGDGRSGSGGHQLSSGEMDARTRALTEARKRQDDDRIAREADDKRRDEEALRQAEEDARLKVQEAEEAKARGDVAAPETPAAPVAEAPAAPAAPVEARRVAPGSPTSRPVQSRSGGPARADASPGARAPVGNKPPVDLDAAALRARRIANEAEEARAPDRAKKGPGGRIERAAPAPKRVEEKSPRGKLTITTAFDEEQRQRSLASLRRRQERAKKQALGIEEERRKIVREVQLPEVITIQELGNRMAERAVDIIKFLMKQGQMHKINDVIDLDTAELVATEFGHTVKRVSEADVEEGFIGKDDDEGDLVYRAPVVTIMGHVDHGKTSLLDALRHANVVSGEAGGITQHIGAYQVTTDAGHPITFIDTPGHAAFTAMRARGAKVTDIVVLVVAADDGVMPQTIEAINHAKSAGVPMIVAINKIDKPDADPQRVRTDLLQHEILVESMSGETLEVEVSAKQRLNLDKLLDAIHLQSEVLDLKANPNRDAEGVVIEAKLERGRGPVGTVLIQRGTLKVGQIVVAGRAWGRVRALIDDKGEHVATAGPSVPVEVLGFDSAPEAGDSFAVVESEARARELTEYRVKKLRDVRSAGTTGRTSLEQMMGQLAKAGKKEFMLIIKGDVQGSVEAITAALDKLGTDEVGARVVHSGVGGITESDISLAGTANSIIIGFNVRANVQARAAAEHDGVEIRYYNVIYNLVDDVKAAMSGLLSPTLRENFLGNAEILEVFDITKVGKVAGCRITEGKVERGASVRLVRDSVVIHEGKLSVLKRFKDDVKEVQTGQECGMSFEGYHDLKKGDVIECYRVETIQRSL